MVRTGQRLAGGGSRRRSATAPGPRSGIPRLSRARTLGNSEFRGLWIAQVFSLVGDQLARVALTVLVFDRTGSAAASAAAYAVTMVPWLIAGPLLAWLGDRYPRRTVMISCDLGCAMLVAAMAIGGLPVPVLCGLLFLATLLSAPFAAARSALMRDVFPDDRYSIALAVAATTGQFAQVAGFLAGGLLVTVAAPRQALLIDAATFLISAIAVRATVRHRPASRPGNARRRAIGVDGLRLVFGNPHLRRLTLYAWLACFHVVPAGVVAPYAAEVGGGSAAIGLLLAATALGAAASMLTLSRYIPTARRSQLMEPLAVLAAAPLIMCVARPGLTVTCLLWAVAGAGAGYQLAANLAFVQAVPDRQRAQAFGVVTAGLVAGQGAGIVLAGTLAEVLAPHLVVAVAGVGGTVTALVLWAARRPDHHLDEATVSS